MFTGIVEELGIVTAVRKQGILTRFDIQSEKVSGDIRIGDSVSVNGACLTVVAIKANVLSFEVIPETIRLTTLKQLRARSIVNLERALKVGDRLGGHFVTGHVDCTGVIRSKRVICGNLEYQIAIPAKFLKFVVLKGSVAIDGISLTITQVKSGVFSVCLIPHTAKMTTLGVKKSGDQVNVESDILLKKS